MRCCRIPTRLFTAPRPMGATGSGVPISPVRRALPRTYFVSHDVQQVAFLYSQASAVPSPAVHPARLKSTSPLRTVREHEARSDLGRTLLGAAAIGLFLSCMVVLLRY